MKQKRERTLITAGCDRCHRVRLVNVVTVSGAFAGRYCADCFDRVCRDPPGDVERRCSSSGPNHNDPWFDNVVRAMEEDR